MHDNKFVDFMTSVVKKPTTWSLTTSRWASTFRSNESKRVKNGAVARKMNPVFYRKGVGKR